MISFKYFIFKSFIYKLNNYYVDLVNEVNKKITELFNYEFPLYAFMPKSFLIFFPYGIAWNKRIRGLSSFSPLNAKLNYVLLESFFKIFI